MGTSCSVCTDCSFEHLAVFIYWLLILFFWIHFLVWKFSLLVFCLLFLKSILKACGNMRGKSCEALDIWNVLILYNNWLRVWLGVEIQFKIFFSSIIPIFKKLWGLFLKFYCFLFNLFTHVIAVSLVSKIKLALYVNISRHRMLHLLPISYLHLTPSSLTKFYIFFQCIRVRYIISGRFLWIPVKALVCFLLTKGTQCCFVFRISIMPLWKSP